MPYLDLSSNSLSGTLPPQWSNLTNIQTLILYSNSLSGALPSQWGSLTNMRYLRLPSNSLNGTLPPQWSSLSNIRYVYLSSNSLSGTLPPEWSNLTNMQTLQLYSNALSGTLPPRWGTMVSMQDLQLYSNSLSGTLPPQWSNLTNMQYLNLHNNSLRGTLPSEWGGLSAFLYCRVYDNCLNTSNATAWWTAGNRTMSPQRSNCPAVRVASATMATTSVSTLLATAKSTSMSLTTSTSSNVSLPTSNSTSVSLTTASSASVSLATSNSTSVSLTTASSASVSLATSKSIVLMSASLTTSVSLSVSQATASSRAMVSESPTHVIDQPVVASRVAAVARTVAIATAIAPMLAGAGIASMGCSAVQLSVASSLLANRRGEPSSIDGIGESLLENPLQLALSSFPLSLQMTGGAVVGNAVVCLIVVVCAALVSHVLEGGQRRCDVICVWRSFRAYFVERLPGALLAPVGLLLQPTLASSFSLMVSPHRTAGSCALGAVGLVAMVGGLVWTTVAVRVGLLNRRVSCTTNLVALLPSGIGCCHATPRCHWAPLTASHDDRAFFLRFGPFFSDTMNNRSMYFALDLWSTVAAALISAIGLSLDDAAVALPASGVLCGIAVVRLLTVVGLRPHSVSPSNVFAALLEALSAAATVLGCIDSGDAGVEASLWLSVVQTSLIGLSGLADGIIRVCVACRAYFSAPADERNLGPQFLKSQVGYIGIYEGEANRALRDLVTRICAQQMTDRKVNPWIHLSLP